MQNVLYAGLRNPERDQIIFNALADKPIKEVAELMSLAPSTVRAAARRISDLDTFNLKLTGGGCDIPIGAVAAKSFRRAALGAYRHFCGTFRCLELNQWAVTDGEKIITIQELRDLDSGMASVNDKD
ncbi:MAG: hypothetical protein V7764_19805 [Pseudomonas marincola]|jgi:hypothetical protein|uniref:hypothetical protein n=1 Tax=Pseudomonas marincola TaxID=437900 RepID=UPI003003413A